MLVAITLEQCWHAVPGGTAGSALSLASGLDASPGIEVIGVAARHTAPPADPWRPSVKVAHHGLPRRALYESWHRVGRPKVEDATGPVDVVHATGIAVPGSDAPLVVTVHDLAFEHFTDHPTRWGLRFFRQAMKCAQERAAAIICPSEATGSDCVSFGFDASKVHVVPWGLDWSVASDGEVRIAREQLELPERFVLWVGTIEPRKNLAALLEAFSLLDDPDLHLVLAGPTGWGDMPVPSARVSDRVHFLGFVAADLLPALYRSATLTCYPSLLEGFGLPVLESMSQATPVVTSSGTATEEVLGEGLDAGGIAVAPDDTDALARAISSIAQSPATHGALATAALARAAGFTAQRTAEETIAVYRSVRR